MYPLLRIQLKIMFVSSYMKQGHKKLDTSFDGANLSFILLEWVYKI